VSSFVTENQGIILAACLAIGGGLLIGSVMEFFILGPDKILTPQNLEFLVDADNRLRNRTELLRQILEIDPTNAKILKEFLKIYPLCIKNTQILQMNTWEFPPVTKVQIEEHLNALQRYFNSFTDNQELLDHLHNLTYPPESIFLPVLHFFSFISFYPITLCLLGIIGLFVTFDLLAKFLTKMLKTNQSDYHGILAMCFIILLVFVILLLAYFILYALLNLRT